MFRSALLTLRVHSDPDILQSQSGADREENDYR